VKEEAAKADVKNKSLHR
jgi:hypothetical protein